MQSLRRAALPVGALRSLSQIGSAHTSASTNHTTGLGVLPWSQLALGNDVATARVVGAFCGDGLFERTAEAEARAIVERDANDEQQLIRGIQAAVEHGILFPLLNIEPTTKILIANKTGAQVADEIISHLPPHHQHHQQHEGLVVVVHGRSGTGKGTTVSHLSHKVSHAVTWSNGNVFRALTLLAALRAKQNGVRESDFATLTHAQIEELMPMISVVQNNTQSFDLRVNGFGLDTTVSKIANTELQSREVVTNVPLIARIAQGSVIRFVAEAVHQIAKNGCSVLMEGRKPTLDFVRTPHRFELVFDDNQQIGRRRCAQKMLALARDQTNQLQQHQQPHTNAITALRVALEAVAKSWSIPTAQ